MERPAGDGEHAALTRTWRCFSPIVLLTGALCGCGSPATPPREVVSITRPVGAWQGRGTMTVGDVQAETGRFRIYWETANAAADGSGTFKLTMRSAISGRTLQIVADHRGAGSGTVDFDEGPRTYDFLVESAGVDWQFRVEETSGEYSPPASSQSPGKQRY
jgi:hypothetical protein